MSLFSGFLLSAVIAAMALWRNSLSPSGAVGALVIGTLTFGFGGPRRGLLMVLFFVTSSALSHFGKEQKRAASEKFAKGSRRDLGQVMANGGIAALLATLSTFLPWPGWMPLYIGVLASVNADTWATELGTLGKRPPWLITTGQVVESGTSGGISPLGTLASLMGGAIIGVTAGAFFAELSWVTGLLIGAIVGSLASSFDSLLGATVQGIYHGSHCHKTTEASVHRCGRRTHLLSGWTWLNNDLVNLFASTAGGLAALALWLLLA